MSLPGEGIVLASRRSGLASESRFPTLSDIQLWVMPCTLTHLGVGVPPVGRQEVYGRPMYVLHVRSFTARGKALPYTRWPLLARDTLP